MPQNLLKVIFHIVINIKFYLVSLKTILMKFVIIIIIINFNNLIFTKNFHSEKHPSILFCCVISKI